MKTYKTITCLLSVVLIAASPLALHAGMVDTPALVSSELGYVQGESGLQKVQVESFIAREEVRNQLESLGVSPALAAERVAAMTDSQLQQLALRIQDLPAGSGALGVVVTVLVIVLLLEILGITDISAKI
jgi:hypothetical protein